MSPLTRPLLGASFLLLQLGFTLSAQPVPADHPLLRYTGRFDLTSPAAPRCSWPNSSLAFTLSGGSATLTLKESHKSHWQVVLNGTPTTVLALQPGEHPYLIADQLPPGPHLIELVKRTEASQGITQILGLELAHGARLLPTPAHPRRIEVIGDSITCGFGNEAANQEEKFSPDTQNAWLTYGAIAARAFNADYIAIAASGKKLHPDNTLVSMYDRVLAGSPSPKWDFTAWSPDVIIVNLGTNDFSRENPEQESWVAAYVAFIQRLRSHHPRSALYCAVGPMISEWPGTRKPRSTLLGYLEKVLARANADLPPGTPPARLLDFGVQMQHHGIGAQWHPSVRTHEIMAKKLAAALTSDLGW